MLRLSSLLKFNVPSRLFVEVIRQDHVLRVELNRPDVHNAFNSETISEIKNVFADISEQVASSDATLVPRCVVLTGKGRSFSAGADLAWMKAMKDYSEAEQKVDSLALFDMFAAIAICPLPVIALVNGHALGGGVGLVAACDMAFAHKKCKFGFTEVKLGLIPAAISPFCTRKIGFSAASQYFLTGQHFSADEAARIGLLAAPPVEAEDLEATVASVTAEFRTAGPIAVRNAKQLLQSVAPLGDPTPLREHVSGWISRIRCSPEGQDGLGAFLNRTKAPWVLP